MERNQRARLEAVEQAARVRKFETKAPKKADVERIRGIILAFVKTKQRKMYGGAAMHVLLREDGNPDGGIYEDDPATMDDVYDYEFYSPVPLPDLHALCDTIFDAGYPQVSGAEAFHENTFTIQYFHVRLCDITYVPANIYPFVPTSRVGGVAYVDPAFMMIDFYRQRANPVNSYHRLAKVMERQLLVQRKYPEFSVKQACASEAIFSKKLTARSDFCHELADALFRHDTTTATDADLFVPVCEYATNIYLDVGAGKDPRRFPLTTLRAVCFDLRRGKQRVDAFLAARGLAGEWKEYVPFFQYYGRSIGCLVRLTPSGSAHQFVRLYDNRRQCVPYVRHDDLLLPSFDYLVMFWYFMWLREKVLRDKRPTAAPCAIAMLHESMADVMACDTPHPPLFETLRLDCVGHEPGMLANVSETRQKRSQEGKRVVYRYTPAAGKKPPQPRLFPNSSGNEIINANNLVFTTDPPPAETDTFKTNNLRSNHTPDTSNKQQSSKQRGSKQSSKRGSKQISKRGSKRGRSSKRGSKQSIKRDGEQA
jgi:hypothetical protein